MADEEPTDVQDNTSTVETAKDIKIDNKEEDSVNVDELVQKALDEKLKDIKGNLDKAYNARDEALKKIAEYEQKEKEQELKRLQEEGKHREAFEMQIAEEKARREALEQENIKLSRDVKIRNAFSGIEFRNEKAVEVAFKEVSENLIRNDKGEWVANTGQSLQEYIKTMFESEDYNFLLKQKLSTGGGFDAKDNKSSSGKTGSLYDLSQDEVLKLAAEGKLRTQT